MNDFITHKLIGWLNAYKKHTFAAFTINLVMGIFVGNIQHVYAATANESLKISKPASTETKELSQQIKQLVKELEYSDKVAEDFVKMVLSWKDEQGRDVLVVYKQNLDETKENYKRGKVSKDELAKVEESIAKQLCQKIEKEIAPGPDECFDLTGVIKCRQAQCLSYSHLVYILVNSIGLPVQVIDVAELYMPGMLPRGAGHTACLVILSDGEKMLIDLLGPTSVASKPFMMEEAFTKMGNYWELKDRENEMGLHRRFRILGKNAIVAQIYNNQAVFGQYRSSTKIILYNKSIELDPNYATAYYNRGANYLALNEHTKAILDFDRSIELNSKDPCPYFARGVAKAHLKKWKEAISDYSKTIEIDVGHARAYAERGAVFGFLKDVEKAKKDLLKAINLDPTLKAYVEMLSKQFKLDMRFD